MELEYVLVHRATRGQGVAYELAYNAADDAAADGARFSGLRDVVALGTDHEAYDPERSAPPGERSAAPRHRSGRGRPPVGGGAEASRPAQPSPNTWTDAEMAAAAAAPAKSTGHTNGHVPHWGRTVLARP